MPRFQAKKRKRGFSGGRQNQKQFLHQENDIESPRLSSSDAEQIQDQPRPSHF